MSFDPTEMNARPALNTYQSENDTLPRYSFSQGSEGL